MEKIGPTLTIIPEQRIWTCFGCQYYNHFMERSGPDPKFRQECNALGFDGRPIEESSSKYFKYHLTDDKTPDCCPFLQAAKRDNKIDLLRDEKNI